jgi:WD40 repeat protein
MSRPLRIVLAALLSAFAGSPAYAETDPKPALRILRDECLGCHKPGKAKGGLLLTTREKMMKGGDSGEPVLPGKGADSLLYQLLLKEADPHMPPKKQLSDADVAAVKAWIDAGAQWDTSVFDELPPARPVVLQELPKGYQPVLAVSLAPDDKTLAMARGKNIVLHDISKPERPMTGLLSGHAEPVQSLAWTPDGKRILSGGFRQIRIWEVETLKEAGKVEEKLVGPITALAVTQDGASLFAADGEAGGAGFIHKIDLSSLKVTATWKAHEDNIYALRLSADGKRLASAAADKLARLWDVETGKLTATFEGHTNHVLSVVFNKDATQIATAGADREIKVWDIRSGEQEVSLGEKKIVTTALAWTPDGKAIVAVNEKGGGSIFTDLKRHTGGERSETAKVAKINGVKAMLYAVAVTSDGKSIFAGSDDGRVYVWDSGGKEAGIIQPAQ